MWVLNSMQCKETKLNRLAPDTSVWNVCCLELRAALGRVGGQLGCTE